MSDPENTQRHPRVSARLGIRISTIDAERDRATGKAYFRSIEESCVNVSRGGAFIATEDPVARGRRLLVEIDLPDGPSIQTVGRVVWTKTPLAGERESERSGMGIEFLGGPTDDFQALEQYIAAVSRRRKSTGAAKTSTGMPNTP